MREREGGYKRQLIERNPEAIFIEHTPAAHHAVLFEALDNFHR
jgi:hypothetical protein